MNNAALVGYLNDHLGGARAALDLLEHLMQQAADEPDRREFFSRLRDDIASDRDALLDAIHAVGGQPDPLRTLGGWIAEKFTRMKLVLDDPGNAGFQRFEALEVLLIGISGKRAMWRTLETIAPAVPELLRLELSRLQQRAAEQIERVDAERLRVALKTLTPEKAS
jgi:hypothetical protein